MNDQTLTCKLKEMFEAKDRYDAMMESTRFTDEETMAALSTYKELEYALCLMVAQAEKPEPLKQQFF